MNAHILILPIIVTAVSGLLCLLLKEKRIRLIQWLSIGTLLAVFLMGIAIFIKGNLSFIYGSTFLGPNFDLTVDKLASWVILAVSFFGLVIGIYSLRAMEGRPRLSEYWAYLLWSVGASIGAAAANDLIMLLVFWGFLGLTLYLMVGLGDNSETAAKKTFVTVGGADALMIFGVGIIWYLTGSFQIDAIRLSLSEALPIAAYLCLLVGALAKAGAIPFHGWIPDSAEVAPAPVVALLPSALDKLLGIYLLIRISLDMFVVFPNSLMSILLLVIGSVTVVIAVMMALVQHDLKKLLSYHAVSQVGYMVMGIGTGLPIGIAGGLFHMLNNAIYKSCLFLCGGAIEKRTGTTELNNLGGLARLMPITFAVCLICSLAIAGIPPLNGFMSKWMIYQGLIDLGNNGNMLWVIWLLAAMFGSALTLASFTKVIHAVFMGERSSNKEIKEVAPSMWWPMVLLAALCVIFGVFAFAIPLKYFIYPSVLGVSYTGVWAPGLAALLIIIGLLIGFIMFGAKNIKFRRDDIFIGSGSYNKEQMKVSGVEFYRTVRDFGILKKMYRALENKVLDIYEQGSKLVFAVSDLAKMHHQGMLHTYISWCFLGLLIVLIILVR
ncbi:NADH-quinone oxidoreductase subunit L [Candidatus Margulisiibacteriota bacterium]